MSQRYKCQTVDPAIITANDLREDFNDLRRLTQDWTYFDDDLIRMDESLYRSLKRKYNLPENPFGPGETPPPLPVDDDDNDTGTEDYSDWVPGLWVENEHGILLGKIIQVLSSTVEVQVSNTTNIWQLGDCVLINDPDWQPATAYGVGQEVIWSYDDGEYVIAFIGCHKDHAAEDDNTRNNAFKNDSYVLKSADGSTTSYASYHELRAKKGRKKKNDAAPALPDMDTLVKEILDRLKIKEEHVDKPLLDKIFSTRKIEIRLPDKTRVELEDQNIPAFFRILDDVMAGRNVFLVGGAGTGKTHLSELIAKSLNRGHQTINCNQWTSPLDLLGGETMEGYRDGKLTMAWRNGEILILDELPKLDPNTAGILNEALAKSAQEGAVIQTPKGETVVKHKNFGVMATGNIWPNIEDVAYGANNKQDLSLLDRFVGCVYTIEENHELEKAIVQNLMIWSIANRLRKEIKEKKYESQVSLRWMITARDVYNVEMDRVKNPGEHTVKADEGKTLEDVIISILNTFDAVQRSNLLTVLSYDRNFAGYAYRKFDPSKSLY